MKDNSEIRGCLLAKLNRGDCEHFVGLPEVEDEKATDEYGRPHGWCELCWRSEQINRMKAYIFHTALSYGGEKYAYNSDELPKGL